MQFVANSLFVFVFFQIDCFEQHWRSPFFGHEACDWFRILAKCRHSTCSRYKLSRVHAERWCYALVQYLLGVRDQTMMDSGDMQLLQDDTYF